MKKIIYLIIFFIFLLTLISFNINDYENYIKNNYSNIKMGIEDNNDLTLIDKDIKNYEIVLAGENHYIKFNDILRMKILKYLNKKHNFKYLWLEGSYSFAQMVNNYLESGNNYYLKKILKPEYLEFFIKLYNYNKNLEDSKKIIVIGFDTLHYIEAIFWYLHFLFQDKKIPSKIKKYYDKINKIYNIIFFDSKEKDSILDTIDSFNDSYYNFIFELKKSIQENKSLYENILGEEFNNFYFIINSQIEEYNILKKCNFSHPSDLFYQLRDELVYKRFANFYKNIKGGKVFGQFGYQHICQKKISFLNLAQRLNFEDPYFKHKVLSIRYLYINSLIKLGNKNYTYYMKLDETYGTEFKTEFVNILKKYSKDNLTLFRLIGENSPFSKKGNLVIYYPKYLQKDVSTTDFYQYIIVVKNSPEF